MMSVPTSPVRVETRFGALHAHDSTVIEFPEGIPGFERCRRWMLIEADEIAPLKCLQSLDAPEPSFLTVDPALVVPGFQQHPGPAAQARLNAAPGDVLLWVAIVTLTENNRGTVNLKAPIAINTTRMRGCQIILDDAAYPVDSPL